ncbi:hypothetical protein ACGFNU_49725 [Spirillospora sp. NPDC048911]|uniref:hypothetical protein n=1 Tax=Spirillospora sp. NPDC048911 TaxID=3364527 RepID=UPI003712CE67
MGRKQAGAPFTEGDRDLRARISQVSGVNTGQPAIDVGIDDLPAGQRDRYLQLAVFTGRGPFSIAAAAALWPSFTDSQTRELLVELSGRSLVICEQPAREACRTQDRPPGRRSADQGDVRPAAEPGDAELADAERLAVHH